MKRVIVDYAKLTTDILDLLVERYPDGYDHSDIISFKNSKGETVKAVEVNTEDTLFLVKISSQLQQSMEDHETDDEDNDDTFDEIEITGDFDNE
ncbi:MULTISPECIES: hypothetical protein [Tenacibaculum]|uniref:DNA primase n=1 Tax=Tenacibaculum discolor TaxID=361581 RepID=A0A2G1BT98_9FLAO|nr:MULTISPECIES: hypothetical protein [Tenacibaculum]PHO00257.1 hypothetical protein CSC82_29755 [Rhodobacteraceae bacterium 4F10]MDP2542443.1 hypothetical protein [Tenacibaculum discolor]NVK08047.1 hypothetical protein [Tenacibaculum sp.]PHN97174.1 hypothetical protein CSC81_12255 [Tenacibaculum discolor]RLK06780.1 hypothetical protein C8N27_0341 [Tenacibaculum discolor]